MVAIPFVGPTYTLRSQAFEAQRCINLYPEVTEFPQRGKEIAALYGTPGLRHFTTLATGGGVRGLYTSRGGRVFAAQDRWLYEINPAGGAVAYGQLLTTNGPVRMADNGLQLMVVDGTRGYLLTLATNVFQIITDPDFPPGATHVGFLDGYFVVNEGASGRFYVTALYDGSQVDALDVATAEGSPDPVTALLVDHREVWLMGPASGEIWFNAGDADFPLARIQGAFLEEGIAAPGSLAKMDNSVFWVGASERGQAIVWRAANYQPLRISTHAVEYALAQYPTISDATAFAYQQEGHSFYVLSFPSGNATWAYDAGTGLWHERASLEPTGTLSRHRAHVHTFGHGRHLVGDYSLPIIYTYDLDYYSDNGQPLPRIRHAQSHARGRYWSFHESLEIRLDAGIGLAAGQGSDPQMMLQWSDDDGSTWSSEHWVTMGNVGAYGTRARWRRLGRARERIYRIRVTDPVRVAIIGADLEATEGIA